MLRQKDLCPSPPECPEVLMSDPLAGPDALPCPHCPAQALREYLDSPGGAAISVAIDLDFAIQTGIPVRLDQILYPEFILLRTLCEERNAHTTEEMKKNAPKRH